MLGSKTVSMLNGKVSPSCGYTSYKNLLAFQGADELKTPTGDIITGFDNLGKYVNKKYLVNSLRSPTADIITVVTTAYKSRK